MQTLIKILLVLSFLFIGGCYEKKVYQSNNLELENEKSPHKNEDEFERIEKAIADIDKKNALRLATAKFKPGQMVKIKISGEIRQVISVYDDFYGIRLFENGEYREQAFNEFELEEVKP
jgi:hypothetical protein